MNDNLPRGEFDDGLPKWLWNIVEKYDIGLRAQDPTGGAFVLCADTCDLMQEILDPLARERWSTARIRLHLHKAIDMLIDAERLASMGV